MTTCWLCSRDIEVDLTVRVKFEELGLVVDICDTCWSRGEPADVEEAA